MSSPTGADPRPAIRRTAEGDWVVVGRRCRACAEPVAYAWPRCPSCGSAVEPAHFGPRGTVWSSTVVRIAVPGHAPPYSLAYVDLDDGPRVLAHVPGRNADEPTPIGSTARLIGVSDDGDLQVEVTG
ncbi:Zn-ribbon domain-containing OB-fold protein [Actinomycetospora lemnae]|uniref:OB-fold domain-containing protein n=1 Tax=Actinomycetospora lemnae TaxID=3019891 RepID=A0ABT5SRC0_9PSEU|nr:OB-fold domain-containing protein [Actinomycetospora sp. DW7H6]MDD7965393.1 OB-fold domain-containing protein [Actinomycetospora sp. DW7H6]